MNKVLVVAAHPDDEILGVGATAARHAAMGDTVYALILGEGQTSRWAHREKADRAAVEALHRDSLRAASIIGYKDVYFQEFPDNRFDSVDLIDIVKGIERFVQEIRPDIIYTHHKGDLNIDHEITHRAVLTAARPVNDYTVRELYAFETVSSSEWNFGTSDLFRPNVFVDCTKYFQKKLEAMKMYQSELREFPHPRSLRCLELTAERWGSVVGKGYVEAFELVRRVIGDGEG